MKNKKLLAMTAMVITASVLMSACSFGGNDKKEDTPAVAVTPTACLLYTSDAADE